MRIWQLQNPQWVDEGCAEWFYMWGALSRRPINIGLRDPYTAQNDGEVWQYMGSANDGHCFRHRNHPRGNKIDYQNIIIPWMKRAVITSDLMVAVATTTAQEIIGRLTLPFTFSGVTIGDIKSLTALQEHITEILSARPPIT